LNQFENNLKARENKTIKDEEDIKNLISESLKFFDDVVVREEIYTLYLKRMKVIDEIAKLEKIKADFDKKALRRSRLFF